MVLHAINRETFEFTCSSEAIAGKVQREVELYLAPQIHMLVANVLSEHAPGSERIMIDTIEIDLGKINLEDIDSDEVLEKFEQALKEKLRFMPAMQTGHYNSAGNSYTSPATEFEVISSFMQQGDLPWWVDKTQPIDHDRILSTLISNNRQAVQHFLAAHAENSPVLFRLAAQYKPSTRKLVDELIPGAIPAFLRESLFGAIVGNAKLPALSTEQLARLISAIAEEQAAHGDARVLPLLNKLAVLGDEGWMDHPALVQGLTGSEQLVLRSFIKAGKKAGRPHTSKALTSLQKLSTFQRAFLVYLLDAARQPAAIDHTGMDDEVAGQEEQIPSLAANHPQRSDMQHRDSSIRLSQPVTREATIASLPGNIAGADVDAVSPEESQIRANTSFSRGFQNTDPVHVAPPEAGALPGNSDPGMDAFSKTPKEDAGNTAVDRSRLPEQKLFPNKADVNAGELAVQETDFGKTGQAVYTRQPEEAGRVEGAGVPAKPQDYIREDKTRPDGVAAGGSAEDSRLGLLAGQRTDLPVGGNTRTIADFETAGREEQPSREDITGYAATGISPTETGLAGYEETPGRGVVESMENAPFPRTRPGTPEETAQGKMLSREQEPALRQQGLQRHETDDPVIRRKIRFIMKRLKDGNAVMFNYLKQLEKSELDRLHEIFKSSLQKDVAHKRAIGRLLEHPYLLKYDLLNLYANLSFTDPSGRAPDLTVPDTPGNKRGAARETIAKKIQFAQAEFLSLAETFSLNETLVIKDILTKQRFDTRRERSVMRRLLNRIPAESIGVLDFLTGMPEDDIQPLAASIRGIQGGTNEETIRFKGAGQAEPAKMYIENAGLCLVALYLPGLYSNLGYLENRMFRDKSYAMRALYVLQYLATGNPKSPEFLLQLNKLLCGFEVEDPITGGIRLTKKETTEADSMIGSVIANWKALKSTSIDGFRASFLQRKGILFEKGACWTLQVEKKGHDVLLNNIPWSFGMIKLPWMKKMIEVEW